MKKCILIFISVFSVLLPSVGHTTELKYRVIQSWQSDKQIKLRSWWEKNLFHTLEECEKMMVSAFSGNDSYLIKKISVLNNYDEAEDRVILYLRRSDGTIQVQWLCVDFKS